MAPLHDASMADVGGLGEPGRAGGIDVECAIFDGGRTPFVLAERFAGILLNLEIDTAVGSVLAAMKPNHRRVRKMRQGRSQLAGELRSDDEMFRRRDADAVGERWAWQIGIEQGNDATDAGDAKPYGEVFRTVGHQQADDFAFCDTLGEVPSGILIDSLGEPSMGQTFALGFERRLVTVLLGQLRHYGG